MICFPAKTSLIQDSILFFKEALLQVRMMRSISHLSIENGENSEDVQYLQRALSVRKSKTQMKKVAKVNFFGTLIDYNL